MSDLDILYYVAKQIKKDNPTVAEALFRIASKLKATEKHENTTIKR
jgi:hypothetical protein